MTLFSTLPPSSRAKTLTLASVARMSDEETEAVFRKIRWASNNGDPFCPKCGCTIVYDCRRATGTVRWRCKACRHSFSITSGILFHSRKLPLRAYLLAIAIFCNEVKGKSMLALSRDLGTHYMTAFVLAHKMREAMASEVKTGDKIGGEGRKAEIDGGYFGGYVNPANLPENRRDRRLTANRSGKRQCVVVIRERDGLTLPGVFKSEGEALDFIHRKVAHGTEVHADESGAWNALHGRFLMKRINHQEAYSLNDACTNDAESFFARMRRAEIGHHHHIAGPYLVRFAQEMAWREDHRRDPNGFQVDRVVALAMRNKPSVDFCGYWQRSSLSN
jgi:transposase-like protein